MNAIDCVLDVAVMKRDANGTSHVRRVLIHGLEPPISKECCSCNADSGSPPVDPSGVLVKEGLVGPPQTSEAGSKKKKSD